MKQLIKMLVSISLFYLLSFPLLAMEIYHFDPLHSYVLWHVNHFGFSNPSGKWMAEGTLKLDEKHPQKSEVSATIHIADMITGIPKLDEHLKSDSFFDIQKFPVAEFKSTQVNVLGKTKAKIQGILTLHGISKPVTLLVTLNKIGISPVSNKKTVGFSANTQLKRSDFGMGSYLPGLSDDVKIDIEMEAN